VNDPALSLALQGRAAALSEAEIGIPEEKLLSIHNLLTDSCQFGILLS
jgi:hypothetical protein